MIAAIAIHIAYAWAIAAGLQLTLWAVQQRTRNAGIVDVGWAAAFLPIVACFAITANAPISAWLPIAIIVSAWSLRLTLHLIARGASHSPEEGRYVTLRTNWGPRASRNFFIFFQAQAALTAVLSLAFVVPFLAIPTSSGAHWLRYLGATISALALLGETIADAQLRRSKRTRPGALCDTGLWAYSRHPNYFFEWCLWLGYAVYGLAFWPVGTIAIFPQALILASIFGVTGIPPTEAQALLSKGDAYRDYQKRVSRFVPLSPNRT